MERSSFPISWCIQCGALFVMGSGVLHRACADCAAKIRIDEPEQSRPTRKPDLPVMQFPSCSKACCNKAVGA